MDTIYESDNLTSLSSGQAAYDALLDALRSGQITPGARLRETELSELLRLSRTPIREALRRLEAEGLVEHRPRIGAMIRKLSHTELVELYEMRVVLESTAAALAAKHATEPELEALDDLNTQIVFERENPARAAAINKAFHEALYHAGRNRFLLDAARGLNNSLLLLGPTTFTDEARIDTVVEQHQAIINALLAGDSTAASAAAKTHLQTSLRHRLRRIEL